jgi:hypothetical protein
MVCLQLDDRLMVRVSELAVRQHRCQQRIHCSFHVRTEAQPTLGVYMERHDQVSLIIWPLHIRINVSVGLFLGPIVGSFAADSLGRKFAMYVSASLLIIVSSYLLMNGKLMLGSVYRSNINGLVGVDNRQGLYGHGSERCLGSAACGVFCP